MIPSKNRKPLISSGPSIPLSLGTNFLWTFAGRFVYAGCQWGIIAALAKLGSPELLGRFSLGLAITAPIIMFTQLQLRAVQATDARGEYQFGHYLALRIMGVLFALVMIGMVILACGYQGKVAIIIFSVGLFKALESVSDIHYGLMQSRERMDFVASSLMIKGPLLLLALVFILKLSGDLFLATLGMVLALATVLIGYERPVIRRFLIGSSATEGALWHWRRLARLAWLALPLGLTMVLLSLNTNFPRYYIERSLGERELGFFTALAYILVAGNTIVSALGQSASPRLANFFATGNIPGYRALLLRLVVLGVILGLGGLLVAIVIGEPLLTLLYRPEYGLRNVTFIWLMFAGGLSYVAAFLGYGMTAARRFRVQLPLFAMVAVVTGVVSVFTIPHVGLNGGAIALCCGAIIQIAGSALIIARSINQNHNVDWPDATH